MSPYRTEIVVPRDRYVCLQLPDHLPDGPATVTVHFHAPAPEPEPAPARANAQGAEAAPGRGRLDDPDREDIEWWEEFDGEDDPLG